MKLHLKQSKRIAIAVIIGFLAAICFGYPQLNAHTHDESSIGGFLLALSFLIGPLAVYLFWGFIGFISLLIGFTASVVIYFFLNFITADKKS